MRFSFIPAVAALIALGSSSIATALPPPAPAQTGGDAPAPKRPTLIVAISVDQFSADLFAEYRQQFTGGFARLVVLAGHGASVVHPYPVDRSQDSERYGKTNDSK